MGKYRVLHLKNGGYNVSLKYDLVLEMTANKFNLCSRGREQHYVDQTQFLLEWWFANSKKFGHYKTKTNVGNLFGFKHDGVIHYTGTKNKAPLRKRSYKYKENTEGIKNYMNYILVMKKLK